jgi:hypothetical protein
MKKIMKLAVITTLMAIGIATTNAQSTFTNVVLNVNISLNGFRQSDESNAAPVRVSNKDIFGALNITGKGAKLIAVRPAEGGDIAFYVRERSGSEVVDTLVTGMSISFDPVVFGANGLTHGILTVNFDNGAGTSFSVSGVATQREGRASGRGTGTIPGVITGWTGTVSGAGQVDSQPAVLRGNVNISGAKAEIIEVP